jgi:hypothetical protein
MITSHSGLISAPLVELRQLAAFAFRAHALVTKMINEREFAIEALRSMSA